jgi:anti-sigma28 factor (negative regulator of flagellin synthesis)
LSVVEKTDERPFSRRPVEVPVEHAEKKSELTRQPTPIGEGNPAMRLSQIQEQIGRGQYQIDTHAVADAIIRRLLHDPKSAGIAFKRGQAECS